VSGNAGFFEKNVKPDSPPAALETQSTQRIYLFFNYREMPVIKKICPKTKCNLLKKSYFINESASHDSFIKFFSALSASRMSVANGR